MQLVARIVYVHLVARDVLHMPHGTLLLHIGTQAGTECRVAITIRMVGNVLGIQDLFRQFPVAAQATGVG